MKIGLSKKTIATVLVSGLLLTAPIAQAEEFLSDYGANKVYCPVKESWNIAIPLMVGEECHKIACPDSNTSVRYKYQSINSMDKLLWETRPEIMQAIADKNKAQEQEFYLLVDELKNKADKFRVMYTEVKMEFSCDSTVEVKRSDLRALSYLREQETYRGGARPLRKVQGTTFDTIKGKELAITDVCTNLPELLNRAKLRINEKYNVMGPELREVDDSAAKLLANDGSGITWTLGYQGVTLYYNPDVMAHEVFGTISVTVPFKGNEDIFERYYMNVPSEYLVNFAHNVDYSLKNDGKLNHIEVGWVQPEGCDMPLPIIAIDDNVYKEQKFECQRVKPLLVQKPFGTVLLLDVQYGDYHTMAAYDVTDGTAKFLEALHKTEPAHYGVAGTIDYTDLLTRPDAIVLDSQITPLSTCKGRRKYAMPQLGVPKAEGNFCDKYYRIVTPVRLTLKKELSVEILDEGTPDKSAVGKETLKSGTVLIGERTDNETYVDFRILSDGRYCRVRANLKEWPHTVNGERDTDVFDGVSYST